MALAAYLRDPSATMVTAGDAHGVSHQAVLDTLRRDAALRGCGWHRARHLPWILGSLVFEMLAQ
jgi:hypothetical protein